MRSVAVWFLLFVSINVLAEPVREMQITNPKRNVGYVVGDMFKRRIDLEVAAPYTLSRASLPAAGLSYGGIEVNKVEINEKKLAETTRYRIEVTYQIFVHRQNASKIRLPAHPMQISANGKSVEVPIPAWSFRVSPLAAYGETDIERDMRPYRAPLKVQTKNLKLAVGFFLLLVLGSLAGLIYINADKAWFPGMGGPFAASYRSIASLQDSPEALNKAVAHIQNAFNVTFGENLFGHDLDRFIQCHPGFSKLRHDMKVFFKVSNYVFFGVKDDQYQSAWMQYLSQRTSSAADAPSMHTLAGLKAFCRACRDCERGVA